MENYENSAALLDRFVQLSLDKKGQDVTSLCLTGLTLIADYFLLVTATSTRQGQAIADHLFETMKEEGCQALRMEGYQDGRWILLDYGTVVVHIFQQEERAFYDLETLWGDAKKQTY